MNARHYAQALYELLGDAPASSHDAIIQRFLVVVAEHGRQNLLPRIMRRFAGIASRETKRQEITVVTPKEGSEDEIRALIREIGVDQKGKTIVNRVDPKIITGHIIRTHQQRFDASSKTRLLELYRNVVA